MMRAGWRGYSTWVLWLAFTTSAALALDPHRSLDHYGHQAWRTDSGLPQNTIHSILQTRDGFMWLGTDGGLVRFDGVEFVTFDAENTPQFKSDTISDLLEDHAGNLWISTSAGLVGYHGGVFTAYTTARGLPADTVWFSYEDHRQRLWAFTPAGPAWFDGKIFRPLAGAQAATPLHRQSLVEDARGTLWLGGSSGVFALDTAAPKPQLAQHLLSNVPVEAIELDRQGNVWMGTGEGLERYTAGTLVPVPGAAGKHSVTALHDDRQGGMWVGSAGGVTHVTAAGTSLPLAMNGLTVDRVDQLFEDSRQALWISTERGLFRFNGSVLESFARDSALAVNPVLAMFEDREGSLWLGTDSAGLHLLRDQKFATYTTSDGLSGNSVRCVFQSANGTLWIGTDGAGLNRRTSSGFAHYSTAQGLSSNVILSLADGGHGDLWIGTPDGLNLLHLNGRVEHFTSAEGLPDDFIRSLANDRDGSLWVGTRHGLAHLAGGKWASFSSMDGLGSDFIGAILRDGRGPLSASDPLWIGTSAGLSRLEGGVFRTYTVQQGLSNNTITAIAQDHSGTVWLGTNGGGLNRVGSGKPEIQPFPAGPWGLPNTIYSVLEDGSSHLWMSSETGIFRVSLAQLNGGGVPTVNAYGTADGMNIRECSGEGHPGAWKLADGSLWFATLDGVSTVEPEQMPENRVPPPVALEQILIDDHPLPLGLDQQLTVKPGANRLEFQYAGLSFVAPQKIRYRYQLEGFDHGWIDAGTRRAAFYTNLPPGSYRFRVLAANNDGVWNLSGASFGLRMMPHFYQTWWFYSSLVLAVLLLGYLIYRWRVLVVEAEWGAVLRERGRIAREIHDTLAQGFVGISVQLELVARLLSGSRQAAANPGREPVPGAELEPVFEQLDQARALVRASLADARTSIWDLRSEAGATPGLPADQPDDLPARLSRSCTRIAGGSPVKVYLQVKGTYRPLERRMEEELLRIGQEAVANAVRHAAPTRIEVQLIYQAARVLLRVEDDGRGFDPSKNGAEGHYGLQGMQERAGEIAAKLELRSAPGEGTLVSVEAPVP